MSFISSAVSGISNQFTPTSAASQGNQQIVDQGALSQNATTANTNYNNVNTNQAALAQQLQAQANGQGPNIANLQLQQATNQNNQQAAGAVASQRGMNPALAARLIQQQNASNNQTAAGQSGVLRAQQQLAAQQGLANVYGQQAGEANSNLAANESALGNQNNATVSATNAQNQEAGQIQQNNANQQAGILGGAMNAVGSMLQMPSMAEGGTIQERPEKHLERLLISIGSIIKPQHFSGGGSAGPSGAFSALGAGIASNPTNTIDAGLGAGPSASANNLFGGIASGLNPEGGGDPSSGATSMAPSASGGSVGGSAAGGATMAGGAGDSLGAGAMGESGGLGSAATMFGSQGMKIPHYDSGGGIMSMLPMLAMLASDGAKVPHYDSGGGIMSMLPMLAMLAAKGGKVPAMVSPGEIYVPPEQVGAVASGKEQASHVGKKIPGKAKVKGNSPKNDTVPAALSPGGVIIKRTEAQNDTDSREFLKEIQKKKAKEGQPSGYAKVLEARRRSA